MTQNELIINHLIKYGHITRNEAFGIYRITRLAARIKELEQQGLVFIREFLGKHRQDYRYSVPEHLLIEMRNAKIAREYMRNHGFNLKPMYSQGTMPEVRL